MPTAPKSTVTAPDPPAIVAAKATMASVGARILGELKRLRDEARNLHIAATKAPVVARYSDGKPVTAEGWCSCALETYEEQISETVVRMLRDLDEDFTATATECVIDDGGSVVAA